MSSAELHALSAIDLAALLAKREISSLEIVTALHARADEVEERVGAWAVQFREKALLHARDADEARARGEICGPLHGIPLSVKENIDVDGVASTLGYFSRKQHIATSDAVMVRLARCAGAIVLGKTNVPQTLLSPIETTNEIFGTTHNPWSHAHAPGGSSGGESAAIASGMSVFGMGTDIGGSVRVPAFFCGVCALKPTVHRWSNAGCQGSIPGQETVRSQVGPLARSVADLSLLFCTLDSTLQHNLDFNVPPVPIGARDAVDVRKLRIGYFETDGFLAPSRSIQRAVREAVRVMRDAGAEIVEFPITNAEEVTFLFFSVLLSDRGASLRGLLDGDAIIDPLKSFWETMKMSDLMRKFLIRNLEARGEKRAALFPRSIELRSAEQFWQMTAQRNRLQLLEHSAWERANLDALITPPFVTPAVPIGMAQDFLLAVGYAARFNLLNFPAGVVPVTRVRSDEINVREARDQLDHRAQAIEAQSEGLPVGVQVVGRPWREDVVLAVMSAIEAGVCSRSDFPRTPVG